jgi:phosphopantothenate-cysteine ligase
VKDQHAALVSSLLERHAAVSAAGTLLSIDFTTLSDYLHYLQGAAQSLAGIGRLAILYLAAAVSDFYIPTSHMAEHKIQSSDGPLQVQLQLVPKMLRPLVYEWTPKAFVVSFKLETNPDLLMTKSRQALSTYHHQVVIGNILETRKTEVVVVTSTDEKWIRISDDDLQSAPPQCEIEKHIVAELVQRHTAHIEQ